MNENIPPLTENSLNEARSKTILTLFDGDVPGQVGLHVSHEPPLDDTTRQQFPGVHYVVALAISRLWDLGVIQSLTGSLCADVLRKHPLDEGEEQG
jgi:hypothetical protein